MHSDEIYVSRAISIHSCTVADGRQGRKEKDRPISTQTLKTTIEAYLTVTPADI